VDKITLPLRPYHAGVFEHSQMLGDGPGGNAQQIRDRPDAKAALREKLNDSHAAFQRQRAEKHYYVSVIFIAVHLF
jgi:hypothetical protein